MTDDLDSKTDGELNELFAVEIDIWRPRDLARGEKSRGAIGVFVLPAVKLEGVQESTPTCYKYKAGQYGGDKWPPYCTDANAVLPWLEKHAEVSNVFEGGTWFVGIERATPTLGSFVSAIAPTFARAAVLALIRAKRASK